MSKQDKANLGCFSVFFHLLPCNENGNSPPPLHPLGPIIKESHETKNNVSKLANNSAKPGVVARLMGLDSMPNTNLVPKATTPDSLIPRSRSLNFVDYMLKFDKGQTSFRSASFREVPELYQQKKNHVLYWNSGSREVMGLGESRQSNKKINEIKKQRNQGKKNKKISKLKNEPRIIVPSKNGSKAQRNKDVEVLASVSLTSSSKNCGYRKSGLQNKQKKVLSETKQRKNMRKQESSKKIETENGSENLSPVSVLDVNDYSYLYGPDFLGCTSPMMTKSKWKTSEQLLLGDGVVEDRAIKIKDYDTYHDIERVREYFLELELSIHKLTENDIRDSNFTQTEGFEEICLVYEHTIFDILLNEVVNELVELYYC